MSVLEPLLAPARVARALGIEVETLATWRRKGYGPRWYRIGKKIKYSEADIRTWMSAQAQPIELRETAEPHP
jgi:predicted site-specific integrase-resolvase